MEKPFSFKNFLLTNFSPKQIFLKNTFWLFLAQIISRILKFVLIVIAARILGPQEYGSFNYVLSIVGFFFIFADFGIAERAFPRICPAFRQLRSRLPLRTICREPGWRAGNCDKRT